MLNSNPSTLVFDIHGVLIGRHEPAGHLSPGDVTNALREFGCELNFLTNSSSVSRQTLVEQLALVGVSAEEEEIFTAAQAVAHYLGSREEPSRLYLVGSENLRAEITGYCGDKVIWADPELADTVVISRSPFVDEDLLSRLAKATDLELIATCRDLLFPNGEGTSIGPGATVQLVEKALGKQAWVIGKPNTYVLTEVMGLSPEALANTIIVGDSLAQDVALCQNIGVRSVLVSNETAPLHAVPSDSTGLLPDHTINALDQLYSLLDIN